MTARKDILNNMRNYSSEELADAIKKEIVNMYELSKSGNLTPLMRKRIEEILSSPVASNPIEIAPSKRQSVFADTDNSNEHVEEPIIQASSDSIIISETDPQESDQISTMIPSHTFEEDSSIYPSNKGMFKHPFSFKGRIRRMEYCFSYLIYVFWVVIIDYVGTLVNIDTYGNQDSTLLILYIVLLISTILMIWFLFAQNTKRCHDRGNSGWFQLIPLYTFFLLFAKGDQGSNRYGNSTKY